MTTHSKLANRLGEASLALAALLLPLAPPASAHSIEKHFSVAGRPVVTITNNARGRIEIKSWKKPEIVVVGTHSSDKVEVDTEQAGNRIEVITHVLSENAKPADLQADYTITVPEETELQVRTDSGLVVIERVYGDLTFDTVAADLQLQEVGNYLVIRTVSGSAVCTRCLGRMDFHSISGNLQLLQPQMDNVLAYTTSGNIYYDGQFQRRGIYILRNYSGVIEVRFSDADSFDLNATSVRGTVENQAKLKPDPHGTKRHADSRYATAFGTFNEGHAKVELSSFSGTIKIRRRD